MILPISSIAAISRSTGSLSPFSLAEFEKLTVHWGYARELQLSTQIFRNITQGPNITAKFRVASLIRQQIDVAVPISFSMRFAPFGVDFITGASFSKASPGRFSYHGGFRLFASTSDMFGISSLYGIASYRVHSSRSIMGEIEIAPLNDQFLTMRVGELRRFGPAEVRVAVHLLLPIVSNHANIEILIRF